MKQINRHYERIFAIGDIHGCVRTFRKLLYEGLQVKPSDLIVCVGDYVDRGPDSKGVVDIIIELRGQGYEIVTLRGNHEEIMMESDDSPKKQELWRVNGGAMTLSSFGVERYADFDGQYKGFFDDTLFYFEIGKHIIVHAGLNFNVSDPLSDRHAMLWTREKGVDMDWLGDRLIVHGHTPMSKESILGQSGPNVNIDGGCVYPHREGMGWLVALELKSGTYFSVSNDET